MSDSILDRVVSAIGQQFEIESELGRGGMSIVYRARDQRLKRSVAIKVLPPELAHDPAVRTRFAREAHTAAQLSHPHIVPIYDVGDREGIAYLVMALVKGGNLASYLAREPRPPIDEARRILCEVADALAYAHDRAVIHRDIKPDNILIDRETGRALVTDFGIARAIEVGARLTKTGVAVGTPTYMSPEQATGERAVDGRSDVYSLGIVAYQMLTGRVPFTASNSMALLLKHLTEPPAPIADLRPEAPRALCEVVERSMAKSPDDRWPTAGALREALQSDEVPGGSWRRERRQPVRYASPSPEVPRREHPWVMSQKLWRRGNSSPSPDQGMPAARPAPVAAPLAEPLSAAEALLKEPAHLASLTPEQRDDLRLWHGRIPLLDRINTIRGYAVLTAATVTTAFGTMFAVMVEEPEVLPILWWVPIIPWVMSRKLWRRGKSLRERGVSLWRTFLMPRAKWVIPALPAPKVQPVEKMATREVLEGPFGAAIRRAAADRAAIKDIVKNLPKEDRAMLPDLGPTADALVERVAHLAAMIDRLDGSIDPHLRAELDDRFAALDREPESPERERRRVLLERQRVTLDEMLQHRAALVRQLESAGLALGTLRLDLIKLRSSGLPSALNDVTSATQEARALSREIGAVLEAVAEVKSGR
jgi:serine/threonine-protein kinase